MEIKIDFWENHNQQKTNKIIWLFGLITMINLVYAGYMNWTLPIIINLITTCIFIITQISYNKWEKENYKNEQERTRKSKTTNQTN